MSEEKENPFKLLGNQAGARPTCPSQSILETFPNRFPHRDYEITFDTEDFTSLCPVTGQPDFAAITIHYVADQICIETKSLKFYLASYRDVPSFNEEIVNRILEDLVAVCAPRRMTVEGDFSARGGVAVSVSASHP